MSEWCAKEPVVEGWYFLRTKRESDPWKWTPIFVMEEEAFGAVSYWECGTCITPHNGVWSPMIDLSRLTL